MYYLVECTRIFTFYHLGSPFYFVCFAERINKFLKWFPFSSKNQWLLENYLAVCAWVLQSVFQIKFTNAFINAYQNSFIHFVAFTSNTRITNTIFISFHSIFFWGKEMQMILWKERSRPMHTLENEKIQADAIDCWSEFLPVFEEKITIWTIQRFKAEKIYGFRSCEFFVHFHFKLFPIDWNGVVCVTF